MSDRFFTPETLAPGEFLLAGPEAHHLASVRRFAPGDRITLFNGDGNEYSAEVLSTDRKRVLLNVLEVLPASRELPFELTIAAAMPKGDRGDFLVEKLVELGVSRFVPLLTERTIVQPKDARLEKLNHAVIEASKQCGRNVLMRIAELTKWTEFVRSATGWRAVLHPGPANPRRDEFGGSSVIAVGPEGGFTEDEVNLAEAAGWTRLSLGPRILRIETAAIAAAARFSNPDAEAT
ncbi:MAG: RsmE family RNA methyltransferase [Gemmataceae bacterium]